MFVTANSLGQSFIYFLPYLIINFAIVRLITRLLVRTIFLVSLLYRDFPACVHSGSFLIVLPRLLLELDPTFHTCVLYKPFVTRSTSLRYFLSSYSIKMAESKVSMGYYLWKRLASLGIEHVFGVPGDFNRMYWILSPCFIYL